MDRRFEELRRQSQQSLVDFLHTELELARTFVALAKSRRDMNDVAGSAKSLENASKAIEATRFFEGRITSKKAWAEIHKAADELEALISDL